MDPESDARAELRALTLALRTHLEWQVLNGATVLPAAAPSAGPLATPRQEAAASSPSGPAASAASGAPRMGMQEPASGAGAPVARPPAPALASEALALQPGSPAPTPAPAVGLPNTPGSAALSAQRLQVLSGEVRTCTRCKLHTLRTQTVFARGTGASGLCFVGEGPGADEDAQGFPFVGKAGQLLDRMIAAMGFARDDVYICNIVKCRPPENRKPEPDEIMACQPYLSEQLELVSPQVIVALGATAIQGLIGTGEGIMRLRGRWKLYRGRVAVMPTFHPAYLLRNPAAKREVWEDLQAVLRHMGRTVPAPAR